MRWLVVALLVLAGCAASPRFESPREQLAAAPSSTASSAEPTPVGTFSVLVVTSAGAPLAGARVQIRGAVVTTDESGRARLAIDWTRATSRVDVPGFAPARFELEPDREKTVVLKRAVSIEGRAVTTSGAPIRQATLEVRSPSFAHRVTTDELGAFVVWSLAEGDEYVLSAEPTGFAFSSVVATAPRRGLTLVVSRPGKLTVTLATACPDVYAYRLSVLRREGEGWVAEKALSVSRTPPLVHDFDVPPGLYRVEASGSWLGVASVESITVVERGEAEATIEPGERR